MNEHDTTTRRTTLEHTRAALQVLEHTTEAGLPAPFTMCADNYAIDFGFLSLDDLTAWSTWLDEPITDRTGATGKAYYNVAGAALKQPIRCWHLSPTAAHKTPLTVVSS